MSCVHLKNTYRSSCKVRCFFSSSTFLFHLLGTEFRSVKGKRPFGLLKKNRSIRKASFFSFATRKNRMDGGGAWRRKGEKPILSSSNRRAVPSYSKKKNPEYKRHLFSLPTSTLSTLPSDNQDTSYSVENETLFGELFHSIKS